MSGKALTRKDELSRVGTTVRIVGGVWRGRVGFVKSLRGQAVQVRCANPAGGMTDVFWLRPEQLERLC
jgi:hypothetical protein